MHGIVILIVLFVAGSARAQPVGYQLHGDVQVGHKPMLEITAAQPLTDLRLELDRDDGKHFAVQHRSLAKHQAVMLPVGDGAAGKAVYKGTLSARVAGEPERWSGDLALETLVRAPIKVSYDIDHLDLDHHVLQFKLSRPAGTAALTVVGEDGKDLGTGAATYQKEPPDTWLSISWTQPADTRVMLMKLHVVAADGLTTDLELVPWSVAVEHEDVNFAANSAVIEPGEEAKLDAGLAKITEIVKRSERFLKMRLYVAGHTDTVGTTASNRKLSLARARAIAAYFRGKGLALPIAFAGFGEEVLKVKTADETDERGNRRVDYVLGPAAAPPPFKGSYLKARADWKQLPDR
jgi:outer membrane protein OmpA-like peptidoglycan-associated protein